MKEVNGCGCQSGILKWFKPPYAKFFYAACCCHDDDYDKGGDSGDKIIADKMLYSRMLRRVDRLEYSPYKATCLTFIALLYYVSVRIFGRFYFNYKKKE